ncbi:MAG: J domain-containing protein [Bacillota bacterium]|nr:J domain-containing protein [Bacillota bacterium]
MKDPYQVLGITPNATDEQVKTAYREMAKKYHPDNYADSTLADFAKEKMAEINEAYDTILEQRKKGYSSQNSNDPFDVTGATHSRTGSYQYSNYRDVRSLIANNRLDDADQILNGVPVPRRDAEWYFLKGMVFSRRGWVEQAYTHFQTACTMDPSNSEYAAAARQTQGQRQGNYGGYNTMGNGCTACDICTGLAMADCCCECLRCC